jgi:hypothetical protein
MEFDRILLCYDELSKKTKLDYTKNDLLFTPDKPCGDIDVYSRFILDLNDYKVESDNINTDDIIIDIEPEVKKEKLESQTYSELKSNKTLPDLSLNDPHQLERIVKAYNELDKKTTLGYARSDLIFNPEMEYGDINIWQTFIINCHENGIEL